MFKDKKLLITGGTGSFGNAVLQKFLHTDNKKCQISELDTHVSVTNIGFVEN